MSQVITEFVYVQKGLPELMNTLDALGQLSDENKAKFKTAFDNYNKVISEATMNTNEQAAATKNLGTQMKAVEQTVAAGGLGEYADDIKKYGDEVSKTTQKQTSLRAQLRQMKNELASMAAAGQSGSAAFKKMQMEAARLQDDLGDLQMKIKNLASDTRVLDGVVEGFSAIAGGIAAAQGAAALFGDENEDLQKAILKTQGALALATGAQQLMTVAQKESAVATLLQTIRTGAFNVVMTAAIALQTAFGVSSQVAMAMATGGISLLVTAIGFAVYKMKDLFLINEKLGDTTERFTNKYTALSDTINEDSAKQIGAISSLRTIILDNTKSQEERILAAKEYNKIADETNKIDTTQLGNLLEINKAMQEQIDLIIKRAVASKLKETLADENEKLGKMQLSLYGANKALEQYKKTSDEMVESGARTAGEDAYLFKKLFGNKMQLEEDIKKQIGIIQRLMKAIDDVAVTPEYPKDDKDPTPEVKRLEELKKLSVKRIEVVEDEADAIADSFDKIEAAASDKDGSIARGLQRTSKEIKAMNRETQEYAKAMNDFIFTSLEAITSTALQIAKDSINAEFEAEQDMIDKAMEGRMAALEQRRQDDLISEAQYQQQKETIQKQHDATVRQMRQREWRIEKQMRMTEILMNNAVAISRALAESGGTAIGLGFRLATIGVTTAMALALLATQKMPAFAKGTEYVDGPGSGTSDSIQARLSKGERVVPAHINELLGGIKNDDLPKLIALKTGMDMTKPMFADAGEYSRAMTGGEIDYNKLAELFAEKMMKAPRTVVNLDKAGFSLYQMKAGYKRQYLNNYYNG